MERAWKLGDDLCGEDNVLDGFSFYDLIAAVHCNCREVTKKAVLDTAREILDQRVQDMMYLVQNNTSEIIKAAMSGRE